MKAILKKRVISIYIYEMPTTAADMKYKRSLNMKKRLSNFEDVVEMIK
jgi:hypothetical protein